MKKIKICICGALGKMGQTLIKCIIQNQKLKLVSLNDQKSAKISNKITIEKNKLEAFKNADVIIDFSRPSSSLVVCKFAKILNKKVVIGTTGFTKKQENLIKSYSKKIPVFKSGNMSLGVNILEYITKILSKKIPSEYQIGINDNHHKTKIDYPSGTALMLAKAASEGKKINLEAIKGKIFFNTKSILNKKKINFFITRRGKTVGKHSIFFKNKFENIELKHEAFTRKLFAEGALKAAIWISKKKKGLFNMQDMLNLK